jgi:hypothetical protein
MLWGLENAAGVRLQRRFASEGGRAFARQANTVTQPVA